MGRKKSSSTSKSKKAKSPEGRSSKYRNYDVQDVERAFKEVFEKRMSIRSAAAKHGVPPSTLRDRVQGKIKISTTSSGPPPFMPKEDEKVFVKHMLKLKLMGYRYRQVDIASAAADYGHYYGKRDISEGPMSRGWIKKFVDRQKKKITYQEYHFRSKCPFPPVTVQKKYFEELESILLKHNLKDRPHLIYNLSETALTTDFDYTIEPEATIFSCVNALGLKLPPFFIFKGKKPNAKLTKGGPDGLGAVMSESGCPNSRIMQHYLKDHFLKNLEADEEDEDTHVLLLYDGHRSRILFPVIKWALEHKIILFVIPPHCTYTVDPYKVANFNPMEICYRKERSAFSMKYAGKAFDRFSICKVASKAYEKVFTPPAIIASFHEAGIFPFKPKLVQRPVEDKQVDVPDFRRKRKKTKKETEKEKKETQRKKSKKSEHDDEEDEESSESDDLSDFLSDSDDVDLCEEISVSAGRDHSYGACSTGLSEGVTVDGEPAIGHITEEVLVQSADRHDRQMVVTDTQLQQTVEVRSNAVSIDLPVENVSETVQVQNTHADIISENTEVHISETSTSGTISAETSVPSASSFTELQNANAGSQIPKEPKSNVQIKHEYMLIKPRPKSGQSPGRSSESAGQLIRVEESGSNSDLGASLNVNGRNMVIKVIEVSQEIYDRVCSGGEVVISENIAQENDQLVGADVHDDIDELASVQMKTEPSKET